MDKHMTTHASLEATGEQQVFNMTGCMPSCYRKEFKSKILVDDEIPSDKDEIRLYLWYGSTKFERKTQYLTYDLSNFVADFGGYLGLLLGHSLLSFYDFGKECFVSQTAPRRSP
jgi:hypothetical protein